MSDQVLNALGLVLTPMLLIAGIGFVWACMGAPRPNRRKGRKR